MRDSLGRELSFAATPARIVSLVPSWTETLFAVGLDPEIVGITDYCVHPREATARKPRLGGTKNPDLAALIALAPDLVIANKEENRRRDVERLEARGFAVYVTDARSVEAALAELRALTALVGGAEAGAQIARELETARFAARAARREPPPRVAALIWKDPYMVVGGDTFASDLLETAGGANVFASDPRGRYPRLESDELAAALPDVILLPSEPYAFEERDRQQLLGLDCPAARAGRVHRVEGELLSWYGPRMARALATFAELFAASSSLE